MYTYIYGVWREFVNFLGGRSGYWHWLIFCIALVYCAFQGKNVRRKLFYPSICVLVFFFNPIFYKYIGKVFLQGIYWRLLWMLPIIFTVSYALTDFIYKMNKKFIRLCILTIAIAIIIITGKTIFSRETYTEKQNIYEISDAAIEISDLVQGNLLDWKETVIVPNELLCDMRQYSCAVGLLYGRNAEGFISEIGEDEKKVYNEMSKQNPDVTVITQIGKERDCRYIVFNSSYHNIPDDLTTYGYEKVAVIQNQYVVYCMIPEM